MDVYDSTRLDIQDSKIPDIIRNKNIKIFLTALIIAFASFLFFINAFNYQKVDWPSILIALFLLGCAFYGFYLVYSRTINIFNYPAIKKFLSTKDSGSLIRSFIGEMDSSTVEFNYGWQTRGRITKNFIILESFYRFSWIHRPEIIWVYKKEVTRTFFAIPTGTRHSVVIHLSNGDKTELAFDQNDAPFISFTGRREAIDFLTAIHKLAPFAVYGYSNELRKRWTYNKEQFISEVQERMQKTYAQ